MSTQDLSHYVYHPEGLKQEDWDMPLPVLVIAASPSAAACYAGTSADDCCLSQCCCLLPAEHCALPLARDE